MKKIIFIFLLLFIFISNTNALSKFYLGDKVPNMYIEEYDEKNFHNGAPFIIKRDDGSIVYCIDPFKRVSTTEYYNEYNYNHSLFNLTEEQIDRINVIAHYGYNYYNHSDIKWYGITQFLIWKTFNYTDIYFTDSYYGDRITAYEAEVKELEELVNRHYLLPSFANQYYEYNQNKNYKIIDTNNVLYNYEILETNVDVTISNNELSINPEEDGIYEIKLIKKSPVKNNYILYYLPDSQNLLYPGKFNDIVFNLTIEVNSGSITINKFDSEGIDRVGATLKDAVYGIYNKKELITTIKTNSDGMGYINNLPLGEYYIKELEPSLGYKLDTNVYYVNLTKENKDAIINSYENVIKGTLIINKYYGDNNNYQLENGALFDLYDKNNNYINTFETNNGLIDLELTYGEYCIVQKNGIDGYNFVEKQNISILEEKVYKLDLYNELIKGNLIINKYYGEDNNYFYENEAVFELYDMQNNLIDTYITKDGVIEKELSYGDYYLVQTKGIEGYKFVDKFNISIKENKDYIFDLYDEKELLIVEVPNTFKYNYNKIVSIILIIIGIMIIFIEKVKVYKEKTTEY